MADNMAKKLTGGHSSHEKLAEEHRGMIFSASVGEEDKVKV